MSTHVVQNIVGPNGGPVNFPGGISVGAISSGGINDIGIAGSAGFGVGVCPGPLPSGMSPLLGTNNPLSDQYGNYQYSDSSIMVWIPAFYYRIGTGSNGGALNVVSILPFANFASVSVAASAGYALHRAFYDGGKVQSGVFVDKYQCSNNNGIASSIKNGNPLSSDPGHNPFSGLTGAPANNYGGAIAAAKTRGTSFFCNTRFITSALALLSVAHGQASTNNTYNAWYDASGTTNFPKGCNNNALGDTNDAMIGYTSDGYSNCGKTGSANLFSRTTHNGQGSGVADLNGNMWEINPGLTSDGTNLYLLNTAVSMKNVTGGNTGAADLWGATGLAAMYTSVGATFQALTASNSQKTFGSSSQVLSEATSGTAWAMAGLGVPLSGGVGGTNLFGNDGLWDYRPNEMCPISGGGWSGGATAGVWALYLNYVRTGSTADVGLRSASYL